jgi:hypothetical protein
MILYLHASAVVTLLILSAFNPTFGSNVSIAPLDGMIGVHEFGIHKEESKLDVLEFLARADALGDLDTILASFFSDEGEILYDRKRASDTSWYGEVAGTPGMANFNIINGRVTGSATFNGTVYHIYTTPSTAGRAGEMSTVATRIASADFPIDLEGKCLGGECLDESEFETASDSQADVGELDTIDTMIVYTYAAMCAEANQPYPCDVTPENKAPIEDRAALAVEEANSAYELSGVMGRQRLMHVAMVSETYEEKQTFDQMLDELSTPDDGLIDDVHEWRKTYGADLVSMFVDNPVSCGLAWLFNGSPDGGFSVVCRDCATGYYSYVHEQAHNTGAHHDEENCPGTTKKFSHGFQNAENRIRSIMAYDCDIVGGCLRVQRFSSPNVTYGGATLGDAASSDNGK